jgi:hypothetical protein
VLEREHTPNIGPASSGTLMGLPWVRLDTNIYSHDKILALLDDPSPKKHAAINVYTFGLAYSAGHETDGFIAKYVLKVIHGTDAHARLLMKYGLWDEAVNGWTIRNYADRQQLAGQIYMVRKQQVIGGKKGACVRHHGLDCGCWRDDEDVKALR